MKSSAFILSIALFCLPSTSHAASETSRPEAWLVYQVQAEDATSCQKFIDSARTRLAQAQKAFGIAEGTVAAGVSFEFTPTAPLRRCPIDGTYNFQRGCGMPDFLPRAECRLIFASQNEEWSYRLVKTEKISGKGNERLCRANLETLKEDPKNLFAEVSEGGFRKSFCQNQVIELVKVPASIPSDRRN